MYLRAQRFNATTVVTHTTDLYNIFKDDSEITSLMALADGGPDFSPNSELNALYFYRLFRKLNLDMLSVFSYAARYSAFNPVEHLWSPLSNHLSGVVFSARLEGESKAPSQQSGLSNDEIKEKEKAVFDKALQELSQHWKDINFDGFPVKVEKVYIT